MMNLQTPAKERSWCLTPLGVVKLDRMAIEELVPIRNGSPRRFICSSPSSGPGAIYQVAEALNIVEIRKLR